MAQGWTKDQTPEGFLPWNDYYGGWEYKRSVTQKFVFQTPCGMLVKGDKVTGDMSYMRVKWSFENDNAVVNCPFYTLHYCPLRHPLLQGEYVYNYRSRLGYFKHCAVSRTDIPWDYANSVEKVLDDNQKEEDALWTAFYHQRKGRVCRHQCHYNRSEKKWYVHYDPLICAHYNCQHCAVLDKPISAKKANVYYDLKKTQVVKGTGFMPDETVISVNKGIKLLRASETICDAIVKYARHHIQSKVYLENHSFCFFGGTVEVLNVRAERRESRDLLQDLQDVANGISVTHQSDITRQNKEEKHKRWLDSQQRRADRFMKLIRTNGFENLSASDQHRAKKHLSPLERLQAQKQYEQSLLPPPPDPQLTLFPEVPL